MTNSLFSSGTKYSNQLPLAEIYKWNAEGLQDQQYLPLGNLVGKVSFQDQCLPGTLIK